MASKIEIVPDPTNTFTQNTPRLTSGGVFGLCFYVSITVCSTVYYRYSITEKPNLSQKAKRLLGFNRNSYCAVCIGTCASYGGYFYQTFFASNGFESKYFTSRKLFLVFYAISVVG